MAVLNFIFLGHDSVGFLTDSVQLYERKNDVEITFRNVQVGQRPVHYRLLISTIHCVSR